MEPNRSQSGGLQGNPGPNRAPNEAAANILRTQIDSLYQNASEPETETETETAPTPKPAPTLPTSRPATQPLAQTRPVASQSDQWKQYHSAWQNYYQKYYEQHYERRRLEEQNRFFTNQPEEKFDKEDVSVDKDTALSELRQQLLGKVQESATKVKKSRHFRPLIAALVVILVFSFLQYNRTIFAAVNAYVSPGAINPQNIIVDPSDTADVGAEAKLIIPKINVDVPVIYDIGYDNDSQMKAMENGVAHFGIPGANSRPGQVGNTVLSGHSSNDLFDSGMYKFVFAQLDKLVVGDTIYANYEGTRYTYTVTKTEVVKPTEVSKLIYPTDKPILTLITCTPLGTALNRLLVTAEQISPNPEEAIAAPEADSQLSAESAIPGNSPTFIERLFGN